MDGEEEGRRRLRPHHMQHTSAVSGSVCVRGESRNKNRQINFYLIVVSA